MSGPSSQGFSQSPTLKKILHTWNFQCSWVLGSVTSIFPENYNKKTTRNCVGRSRSSHSEPVVSHKQNYFRCQARRLGLLRGGGGQGSSELLFQATGRETSVLGFRIIFFSDLFLPSAASLGFQLFGLGVALSVT